MDSMAASIGISVFNIALTIVNVGVLRFYFELPPFAPFLGRAKAKRRACLRRGLRSRFVGGSPDCGEDERRHARNGSDDCEKKRCGFHAAESSTDGDGRKAPAGND